MAKLLNADYWKKAYLLEFKIDGVLTDAFTFSVPPENEEFIFPQRKNETKTFGGIVVADYGNDIVQISLSGSTINQELKLIYKSRLGSAEMTGEQEIFYLRDLLKKYGSRENLQNKEVYLYSLNGGGKKTANNPKWWRIFVGELSISRNKDKPFCYNYKFSATGAPEVTRKNKLIDKSNRKFKALGNFVDWISGTSNQITENLNSLADQLEELGADYFDELSGYIGTLRQSINDYDAALLRQTSILNGKTTDIVNLTTDTLALGDKVLSRATRIYPTILADVWNSCLDLYSAATNIYDFCANIDEKYFGESAMQSVRELFDDTVTDQDIADTYSTLGNEVITDANELMAGTSKNLNDIGIAIIPGNTGEDDLIVITYGYKVISITDAETNWDQLAQDYYGDASLSYILATYNNLPTDKPLQAGQSILIPNLNYAENKSGENEVYNSPDVKDNYGKDVLIKDGDFAVYNGDLAFVGGVENLEQALLNRYSTLIGARIRVEVYGIQASIGDALNASSALIQASVHQTTVEDPRVDSVENISFEGKGDNLTVTVIYIDKNGTKQNFGGTI